MGATIQTTGILASSGAKLAAGDTVSVISPSSDCAARFPAVYELGLRRLQEDFGLKVKEYPATRALSASPQTRAADINAAFSDRHTKAVFAAIGGYDQIDVLPFVDRETLRRNPKPFFGYSDNTSLHLLLWELGIASYYGGNVMNQFGWPVHMLPLTEEFARRAMFERGTFRLHASDTFNEIDTSWADLQFPSIAKEMHAAPAWHWHGKGVAEGLLWGGCLEILCTHLLAGKNICEPARYASTVLALETSEEVPSWYHCCGTLVGLGERGILGQLTGMIVGRAKAWFFDRKLDEAERTQYRETLEMKMLETFRRYNPSAPAVFNVDFGHTEPQIILPFGKRCTINAEERWISAEY